jgi:hypothetical protein
MSNNPILSVIDNSDNAATDPFDLKALRLTQDFIGTAGVKKQPLTIPVRKPNPQDFVRVHPDEQYRANLLTIELKDDREVYLVHPMLHVPLQGETVCVTIFTAINRQGVLFLWAVRIPPADAKDNAWWQPAREGAELAMKGWVRIKANTSLGAYEITAAESLMAEPEWPQQSFQELLRIAFKDRLVDRLDHPVVNRLRGLT